MGQNFSKMILVEKDMKISKENIKRGLLISVLIILGICAFIYMKHQQQKELERSYSRQNQALNITGDFPFTVRYDKTEIVPTRYYGFDMVRDTNTLYSWVAFYNHEMKSQLTLEDIKDYLSVQFEEDGRPRESKDYPEIQAFIDFIWEREGMNGEENASLLAYDVYILNEYKPYFLETDIAFISAEKEIIDQVIETVLEKYY